MSSVVKTLSEAIDFAVPALLSQYLREPESTHVFAPFIEGPPGIGKSAAMNSALFKKLGVTKAVFISCGVIDPNIELIGLPEVIRSKTSDQLQAYVREVDAETGGHKILEVGDAEQVLTKWIKPERLAAFDDLVGTQRGLLVFDDVHFLLQRQQAAMMQLLTNAMTIHTHKIGSGNNVAVMFLANRLIDNAGAQEFLAPVIDRIKRITIDYDPALGAKEWADWAEEEGDLHNSVVSFVRRNSDVFYTFESDDTAAEDIDVEKFASPRGWDYLAKEIEILEIFNKDIEEAKKLVEKTVPNASAGFLSYMQRVSKKILDSGKLANFASGTVGVKAAREFAAHYEVYSKYDLERFLETDKFHIDPSEIMVAASKLGHDLALELLKTEMESQQRILQRLTKMTPAERRKFFVIADRFKKGTPEDDIIKSCYDIVFRHAKRALNSVKDLEEATYEQKSDIVFATFFTEAFSRGSVAFVLQDLVQEAAEKKDATVEDIFGPKFVERVSKYIDSDIAQKYMKYARFVVNIVQLIDRQDQAVQPLFSAFFGSLFRTLRRMQKKYIAEQKLVLTSSKASNESISASSVFASAVYDAIKLNTKGLQQFDSLVSGLSSLVEAKREQKSAKKKSRTATK